MASAATTRGSISTRSSGSPRSTGRDAEQSLERAGITCNKNGIPFDPQKPTLTSGIRLGSPAATTRGFGEHEFRQVGEWIGQVLRGLAQNPRDNSGVEGRVRGVVAALCDRFPVYPVGGRHADDSRNRAAGD